jgi:hypothetical protein
MNCCHKTILYGVTAQHIHYTYMTCVVNPTYKNTLSTILAREYLTYTLRRNVNHIVIQVMFNAVFLLCVLHAISVIWERCTTPVNDVDMLLYLCISLRVFVVTHSKPYLCVVNVCRYSTVITGSYLGCQCYSIYFCDLYVSRYSTPGKVLHT